MPTAKANPASEITLIERPRAAMATKEPITDTGIATEMMTVARNERKKQDQDDGRKRAPLPKYFLAPDRSTN